jgi:hypothetical protein
VSVKSKIRVRDLTQLPFVEKRDRSRKIKSLLFPHRISGSIHQTHEGLPYLVGIGGLTIISQSNGQILLSGGSGGGEVNLVANVGAGTGLVFRDKTTATLNFKSLIGGTNVTVTDGTDDITISADSGADVGASFIVVGNTASLANERSLSASFGNRIFDNGADSTFLVDVDELVIPVLTASNTFLRDNMFRNGVSIGTGSTPSSFGSDVRFFVSGAIGGRNDISDSVAVMGGDLILSGYQGFGSTSLEIQHELFDIPFFPEVSNLRGVGSSGTLFTFVDSLSGSLGSFNNVSGLPVLEAFSDNTVILGKFSYNEFVLSGGQVGIGKLPDNTLDVVGNVKASLGYTGSLTQLIDGSPYLRGIGGISITTGSSGFVLISGSIGSSGGGGSDVDWVDAGGALYTTSSVAIGTASIASAQGSDVFFFVSGAIGGRDTIANSVALMGGDLVVSGNLGFGSSSIEIQHEVLGADLTTLRFIGVSGSLMEVSDILTGSLFSANNSSGLPVIEAFSDDRVIMGEFGFNDFVLSGNMVGIGKLPEATLDVSGNIKAHTGFTGSLTTLIDGSPYIRGTGAVTVTTASDGSLVISGTGDGGSGGGSLDSSYDFGGAGVGRLITVDAGALQFQGTLGSQVLELTGTTDMTGSLHVDGGAGIAAEFTGSVGVDGAFSATSKSFLISHPVKPGMKLRHGSLEGPEHAVFIRGRCDDGIIKLPEYWKGLVDEKTITVELTSICTHYLFPHFAVESYDASKVVIREAAGQKASCFYVVYAERKDIDKMEVEESWE